MGKAIAKALGAVFVIHVIGLLGLLTYGLATHRFEGEKVKQYLATWHGQKLVAPPEEEVEEEEEESPALASKRIAEKEVNEEINARDMQGQVELIKNMQFSIGLAQKKLEKDIQAYQKESETFYAEQTKHEERIQSEGFQKTLKNYSTMKTKLVKNDFMKMEDSEMVEFLSAMKADVATKILNQFKSTEEEKKRQRVLRLMHEDKMTVSKNKTN